MNTLASGRSRRHRLGCCAGRMAEAGLIEPGTVEPLRRLREHNALLFDVVQKRLPREGTAALSAAVFETRRHFASPRASATVPATDRREGTTQ